MATKVTLRQITLMRKLVLGGYSTKEISEDLNISVNTVRIYTKAERDIMRRRTANVS